MTEPDEEFGAVPGFSDEDIPVVGQGMLHTESVDFEQKMSPWPVVTLVIIASCIVVFFMQVAAGGLEDLDRLIAMGALERSKVAEGELWRTLSAAFLHGGFDHLLGNVLVLYILGMACEHGFGRPQFLFLYVAAALAGSALSLVGGRPSVGASGAIFGLSGALMVLFWRYRGRLHMRDQRIGVVLALWALYQLALGLFNPAIDNLAHLGGLMGGMLVGLVLRPAVLEDRESVANRLFTRIGLLSAVAMLVMTAWLFLPRLLDALAIGAAG